LEARIRYPKASPGAYQAMSHLEAYVKDSGLDPGLMELVKIRASQLNGCAFCLDMHTKDAVAGGETPQRIFLLDAWREAPFYSDRERAVLAYTEAVTRIADGVPDPVFEALRGHFSEKEIVDLTLAIVTINGWNRLAISMRSVPGSYQPKSGT
jgi:AhpD family alkylhydroperoxidase